MKIYLDNNLGVSSVEQEELTQDTIGYNILKVYIPNAVLTPYDTFTCYYGALLQNGRKVGWFAMEARTSTDADYEENYTLYKATLEQCVVSVEGKVYIGCQVLLGNSGNATLIKKNTAVVQFNVRKSVAINNDILVLDTDQTTTDVLESYKNLLENALLTYATKATTYTKDEVNGALALKADKSDTYTKDEVDEKDLNLAGQIASARVELNNRINTTNNILTATQAEVANLKSVQNVVEVVATKSALNSYDTTKLDVNDKVQVIADETHGGASTIYNWSGSAWQYVGAYGTNSYTKQESDNKFVPKATAVTHSGNQLKDKDGNNIYPNLDAKTQAKIDNAYGPAYVGKDTSAHILAFTTNKGIYIGTDTGHWYYWNGTQYVSGGVYQATQIADEEVKPQNMSTPCFSPIYGKNTVVLTKDNLKCLNGYWGNVDTFVSNASHKCISIPITNNKCKLSTSVSSGLSLSVGFLITNDNGVINLGNTSKSNISMANIKELQLNFFNGYTIEFTITFDDTLELSLNDIKDTITYTKANMNCNSGYYEQSSNNIILHPSSHNSLKIALNKDVKLDYEILQKIAVYGGYIEYQDNTIVNLGLDAGTYSRVIRNGKNLYLNFFDSFLESFTLSVIDNSNNEIELKYDDYLKSNYDFNGKKILYVGDSITYGFTSGTTTTQNGYPKLFSNYVGATFVNNAIGGALYTSGYNEIKTLLGQLTNTSNKDTFDYVVLAGGTNDYGLSVTESDFRSAVTATIEYALNNFANAHIIVITPISFLRNNTNTISLQTYRNIITELAITEDVETNNRISIVQGYKFDMPQEQTSAYKTLLLNDGVHPTEEGYKVYTRGLIKALCNR